METFSTGMSHMVLWKSQFQRGEHRIKINSFSRHHGENCMPSTKAAFSLSLKSCAKSLRWLTAGENQRHHIKGPKQHFTNSHKWKYTVFNNQNTNISLALSPAFHQTLNSSTDFSLLTLSCSFLPPFFFQGLLSWYTCHLSPKSHPFSRHCWYITLDKIFLYYQVWKMFLPPQNSWEILLLILGKFPFYCLE